MKKFLSTLKNIFEIEELKDRILYTLFFLLIFRLGSFIVLPGVDPEALSSGNNGGLLGMINIFLGGAFNRASIFALGIMPYISASIVIQLATFAVPSLQKMQKEGESGRRKLNQITRLLTIGIVLAQGTGYITAYIPAEAIVIDRAWFTIIALIILTSGTIFCMWIGERITEKGLGNGISLLIMIGIISGLPGALIGEVQTREGGLLILVLEFIALYCIVMGIVMLTQAIRRVPIQYARQVVNGKAAGRGQRSYLPIKVNSANVMPIIFAQSIMFAPSLIAGIWAEDNATANYIATSFADFTSLAYNITFVILIIVFTFLYTAMTMNPQQMSEDLKRSNAYIPGVQPGEETTNFISQVLDRVTLPGALFLAVVAILPAFAAALGVTQGFAQFYGGTSLIIMVGVVLDTLNQVDSYLVMKHYESMMKSGKIRGRNLAPVE